MGEHGPVERGDAVPQVPPVVGVRDARSGAEGLDHGRGGQGDTEGELSRGAEVGRSGLVEQHGLCRGRQPEAPVAGDAQQPRGGLLLQPFAGVAFVDPRRAGQLRGGQLPAAQGLVQAEFAAQLDGEQFGGAQQRTEQALGGLFGSSHVTTVDPAACRTSAAYVRLA